LKKYFIALSIILGLGGFIFFRKMEILTDDGTEIVVGLNANFPPFAFIEHDKVVGLDVDLIQEIARRIEKKVHIRDMAFKALGPSVLIGKIQVVVGGISPSERRRNATYFTKPYIEGDRIVLLSDPDFLYRSLHDLQGKTVILCDGYSSSKKFLQKLEQDGVNLNNAKVSDRIKIAWVNSPAAALVALSNSTGSFFVISHCVAKLLFEKRKKMDLKLHVIDGLYNKYSIGVSRRNPKLFLQIQEALREMSIDGTLDLIKKRWGF